MRRRRNSGGKITDSAVSWRKARTAADYRDVYKRWHWGVASDCVVQWDDPDLPDGALIEIGRLWELHVRMPDRKDKVIEIGHKQRNASYVAFDPHQTHQRMYLLLPPAAEADARRVLWDGNQQPVESLRTLAKRLHRSAKHATGDYPNVQVKVVGALTDIVYRTHKKGDDDQVRGSSYIHALGEESGLLPALAVDAKGRLWIASGNYFCPTPGITD
jgi:hypothetical protein